MEATNCHTTDIERRRHQSPVGPALDSCIEGTTSSQDRSTTPGILHYLRTKRNRSLSGTHTPSGHRMCTTSALAIQPTSQARHGQNDISMPLLSPLSVSKPTAHGRKMRPPGPAKISTLRPSCSAYDRLSPSSRSASLSSEAEDTRGSRRAGHGEER